jgi:hypothetical protein
MEKKQAAKRMARAARRGRFAEGQHIKKPPVLK